MNRPTAHVPAPMLDLTEDTPVSSVFGDVYFSRAGGVAEAEHVFLAGNGLPERWQGSARDGDDARVASHGEPVGQGSAKRRGQGPLHSINRFTIAELGFGTGLNFLVTLKRFRETADADAVLHYIAIEKYPFTPDALRAVLALQPELANEAAELLAAYPLRLPGIHRIHLPRCVVTLCFGEVGEMLGEVGGGCVIDAWYLDGFSPSKNPEMWGADILAQVGKLSHKGTTFATFTSAGNVRRGLMAAGFEVRKVAGFGHKREMSFGWRIACAGGEDAPATAPPRSLRSGSPCEATHAKLNVRAIVPPTEAERVTGNGQRATDILILGAGIAGATIAHALAERGYRVMVLERAQVASGASGNAAGVLFPQLTKQWNISTAWYFTAYGFALRQLARWQAQGLSFASGMTGMLRLPRDAQEEAQLRTLNETLGLDASMVHWLEREAASKIAGVALQTGAAFFPHGTWISPPEWCRALLQHANIMLREECAANSITRDGDGWAVMLANGEQMRASHVCVTSAHESAHLLADYGLRLNAVGGQLSEIAAANGAAIVRSILCHTGYVIPLGDRYLLGATYHREEMLAVTDARHSENIAALETILPDWMHAGVSAGRSSIRATTPDRMPYVGAVDAGLYVSTGHGSRGLLSAPLAAEMIASAIAGEMSPVTQLLEKAVRPLRFTKA